MLIRLLSDIHEEFGPLNITKLDTDPETVLCIAGDFQVGSDHTQTDRLRELCKQFKAVVYTAGNHEYYGHRMQDVDRNLTDLMDQVPNFHYLQPGVAIIDDVRFIGGTFWTDFKNGDWHVIQSARNNMNDYRQIKKQIMAEDGVTRISRPIHPDDLRQINKEQREFFSRMMDEPWSGRKTVIMTHHAPLMACTGKDDRYDSDQGKLIDHCYGNTGLDDWFLPVADGGKPFDFWFHGHIHHWQEHEIGRKRIIARPRGYHRYEELAAWYEKTHADAELIEV